MSFYAGERSHIFSSIFSFLAGTSWPSDGSAWRCHWSPGGAGGACAQYLSWHCHFVAFIFATVFRSLGAVTCCPTTSPITTLIWLGRRLPTTQVSCSWGHSLSARGWLVVKWVKFLVTWTAGWGHSPHQFGHFQVFHKVWSHGLQVEATVHLGEATYH